jgi:hypothetical protein
MKERLLEVLGFLAQVKPRWLYIDLRKILPVNVRVGLMVASLAIAALLVASSAVASAPSGGFVAYRVNVVLPSGQRSALVNESVGQSSKPGFSDLILQLTGSQQNLTYSRLVNSSTALFPYLSNLASQALDYSNGTTADVHLNFSATGTTTVTFQGSQYTLNLYSFAASGSYRGMSATVNGTLETFPSTLVYLATAVSGNASVRAVMVATNLQLTESSTQTAAATYVGAGLGVGGVALVAVFMARRKDRKVQSQEQKPPHWVD